MWRFLCNVVVICDYVSNIVSIHRKHFMYTTVCILPSRSVMYFLIIRIIY